MKKIAHNRIEMIGSRYGSWTVLAYSHTEGKTVFYLAECNDKCSGTKHIVQGANLRNGASKRCGPCGKAESAIKRTGIKKLKKSAHQLRVEYLFKDKRKNALRRGLQWGLTVSEFEELIFAKCYYSGLPPSTTVNVLQNRGLHSSWVGAEGFITYNGIDRIDSSKGYIAGNVVTANSKINCAKNDDSTEDFLSWVKAIAMQQGWVK